jgi:hypothetical protein
MKKPRLTTQTTIVAGLICWTLYLLLLVSPNAVGGNDTLAALLAFMALPTAILTGVSLFLVLKGLSKKDAKGERLTTSTLAKTLSLLVLGLLILCVYTAIKSLWYGPLDDNWGDRFVYENIATGAGFTAIVSLFFLSALQKNIFWVTGKRVAALDERQRQERYRIFEKSYRMAIIVLLLAASIFLPTIHNIPAIMANNYGAVPGHLYWLPGSIILFFFALPLVLASWKK